MIIAMVGGLVLFIIIGALVRASGNSLARRFESLGDMKGMDIHDIIRVVGSPQSESQMANGTRLFQWQATGYHVALRFAGDKCLGVTHHSR
jgi:hypothetical protein